MGLDTVELVMELEDEFELSIPDAEAEKMQTIGQTVDYLYAQLRTRKASRDRNVCPTQQAFHELRAGLMGEMKVARNAVRPDVAIGSLLVDRWQQRAWPTFALRHGLRAPRFSLTTRGRFPNPGDTLGKLSRDVVANRGTVLFLDETGEVSRDQILERVVVVIAEQCGVDHAELHVGTHYFRDLSF